MFISNKPKVSTFFDRSEKYFELHINFEEADRIKS